MAEVAFDVVDLARSLIDIDSTTPNEGRVASWLASWLRARGYRVEEQPVEGDRLNLYVTVEERDPDVVLSTHLDCVPPFFPSRVEGDLLYGRGACDAKGIAAAQVGALEGRLLDGDVTDRRYEAERAALKQALVELELDQRLGR